MGPRIKNLKTTTVSGRRQTRRDIDDIQETVALCPALNRNELATTICEHRDSRTPKGKFRASACLRNPERLSGVRHSDASHEAEPGKSAASDAQPEMSSDLSALASSVAMRS